MARGMELGSAVSRAAPVRVQGVLNPLLWLAAVASTEQLIAACVLRDHAAALWFLLVMACVTPAAALIAFVWLLISDPDRLDSEAHRLELRKLETKAPRGASRPRKVDAEQAVSESEAQSQGVAR